MDSKKVQDKNKYIDLGIVDSMKKKDSLNIFIRIRPPLERELKDNSFIQCLNSKSNKIFISKKNKPIIINDNLNESNSNSDIEIFTFDRVFKNNSLQEEIFDLVGKEGINNILSGYNSTIFTYGQTGTGKTYTIEGTKENPGLLPNIFEELFKQVESIENKKEEDIIILFSVIQIYMEKLNDLLSVIDFKDYKEGNLTNNLLNNNFINKEENKKNFNKSLIKDNYSMNNNKNYNKDFKLVKSENGFDLLNITEKEIKNKEDAMRIFMLAKKQRIIASTKMNDVSSRGHVIYTLKIIRKIESTYTKKDKNSNDKEEILSKKLESNNFIKNEIKSLRINDNIIENYNNNLENKNLNNLKSDAIEKIVFSKLNIVDLAGSERITKSGSCGKTLNESISINKSLFCLQGVVDSLLNYNNPPFRESKLTMILSDSLGGNCITSLIACVSPSISEVSETFSTLYFASSCKKILNKPIINIDNEHNKLDEAKKRLYGENYKKNDKEINLKKKFEKEILKNIMPWKDFKFNYSYNSVFINEIEEVFYLENNTDNTNNYEEIRHESKQDCIFKKTIILLHASHSNSLEFLHWFPCLSYYSYRIIAIDQPGYGRTKGKPHPCNSQFNLDINGPADVVLKVIDKLKNLNKIDKNQKIIIGGYDWGAGISISLCSKYPQFFEKAITFLPSYAEPTGTELKCLKVPILIIWIDIDQMHLWSKWKFLAEKIPNKKIEMIRVKPNNRENMGYCYSKISDLIMHPIILFLGEIDPLKEKEELINPIIKLDNDIKGNAIKAKLNINFQEEIKKENLTNQITFLKEKVSNQILSIFKFLELYKIKKWKLYDEYMNKSQNNNEINEIFRELPEIDLNTLSKNPNFFVELGVWKNLPKNFEKMLYSPKYFKGRKIYILIPCSSVLIENEKINPYFMKFNSELENKEKDSKIYVNEKFTNLNNENCNEKYLSYTGYILDYFKDKDAFLVQTFTNENKIINLQITRQEILKYNHNQEFHINNMSQLELEDGIRANYSNPLVKAKIIEIAYEIANLIEELDFLDFQNCESIQKKVIITIRRCLNLISFYNGVDRNRYGRTDCVGKLGVKGQAQCHGLSSTMAAYLLPFSEILGFEILYRGGFSFCSIIESGLNKEIWKNYINNKKEIDPIIKLDNKNTNYLEVSNKIEKHQWLQINLRPKMNSILLDLWYQEKYGNEKFLVMEMEIASKLVSYPHPKILLKNKISNLKESDFYFS